MSKRIFIYEFFSAGGILHGDPDNAPLDEGAAMLHAAMDDFSQLDDLAPFTVDHVEKDYWSLFTASLEKCDYALIIAPETEGVLEKLTAAALHRGIKVCGSTPDVIRLTGDKLLFARAMEGAGIAHPKTIHAQCFLDPAPLFQNRWISKPVDGVGGESVTLHQAGELYNAPSTLAEKFLAQEFIEGERMSLSVISNESKSVILSVNRQVFDGDGFEYTGGEISDEQPDELLVNLVAKIKSAIPGLIGYWGLDYISTDDGPVVIEINPRLTTSYCALSPALDINPASVMIDAMLDRKLPKISNRRKTKFSTTGVLTE